MRDENTFSFKDTSPQDFRTQIQDLNTKKAMLGNDIPTTILIKTNNIVSGQLIKFLTNQNMNNTIPLSSK